MSIIKQFYKPVSSITRFRIFKRLYSPPVFKDQSNTKSLNVTESASNQLNVLKQKFPGQRLRVAVEAGGCHGFQYKFSLESKIYETDCVFDSPRSDNLVQHSSNTSQIICDNVSWSMIKDAKLDYQNELIGATFRIIDNPMADSGCGCGVSFDLKDKI